MLDGPVTEEAWDAAMELGWITLMNLYEVINAKPTCRLRAVDTECVRTTLHLTSSLEAFWISSDDAALRWWSMVDEAILFRDKGERTEQYIFGH